MKQRKAGKETTQPATQVVQSDGKELQEKSLRRKMFQGEEDESATEDEQERLQKKKNEQKKLKKNNNKNRKDMIRKTRKIRKDKR